MDDNQGRLGQRDSEFRAYVTRRRPHLVRTATLLTAGDAHLAEDIVQNSLTRLYLAWPRLRRRDGPDAYANRVLVNAFIDETRRPFFRWERPSSELPDVPEDVGGAFEDGDAVRRALAALPTRMRAAVVLRYWLQLDVSETAAVLGCSNGTVKSQTSRALQHLRARLGPIRELSSRAPGTSHLREEMS